MMKTCFISASPLSPQARAFQNTFPAGVLIMLFAATVISCLPPKHHFSGTTLHHDLTHFPCRKISCLGSWIIGGFTFLQQGEWLPACGTAAVRGTGGRLCSQPDSSSSSWLLPPLPRQEWPGWLRAAAAGSSRMSPGR